MNISSLSGQPVLPLHIPYTTTKYCVTGFTEALRVEAGNHGVGVTLVCPGAIRTNIMEGTRVCSAGGIRKEAGDGFNRVLQRGMDPDEAADRVIEAVRKKKFLLLPGKEAYALYYLKRLFSNLMRSSAGFLTRRLSRGG